MIWRGSLCAATASASTLAERAASCIFSASSAAIVEEYGKAMPMASMAEDMVLAVNMPPQEPTPGQEWRSISCNSALSMRPAPYWPTASKVLPMVRFFPA